jgi:hypothetical protein
MMEKIKIDNSRLFPFPEKKNISWFKFVPPRVDGCEILCRICNEWSLASEWEDCEPSCEDCGEHAGIKCPRCMEEFDHVWGVEPPFKTRMPEEGD